MKQHGFRHPDGLILQDATGAPRGSIEPKRIGDRPVLDDLWVMQGSLCDLKCKHCYTASSPTAGHLEQITFPELRPFLRDAQRFGVQRIYFTGGEVFVNEDVLSGKSTRNSDLLDSLSYALEIAPVDILTNGRRHIRAHFPDLARLRAKHGDRLRLRVTLESPREGDHDSIRGRGTYRQTVETVKQLGELGFVPIITAERPLLTEASDEEIQSSYVRVFREVGVRVEISLIENMLEMGHQLVQLASKGLAAQPDVFVTENCFEMLGKPRETIMCHYSRCVQKSGGRVAVYPCPVIYNDPRFELGMTLEESLRRVYVAHKNCYDYCLKGRGATCRTRILEPNHYQLSEGPPSTEDS
jgi:MoaA/NifB/PqqE/SkfB family radical SAM enzyme